jgi:hypothetical protein
MTQPLKLHAGDWAEVRTKEEILQTLDNKGRLDGLPFMPEMFEYCGKRLRVFKRAHKTCDPSLGIVGRGMDNTVHLENVRCDGGAHDGCEQGCLMFWKEAWLKRAETPVGEKAVNADSGQRLSDGCTEADVLVGTKAPAADGTDAWVYVCQATHLKYATRPLPWWDLRQYLEDYTSGNVRPAQLFAALAYQAWHTLAEAGVGCGALMRSAYDLFQRLRGGAPYPIRLGKVPKGAPTPAAQLNLKAGDIVRVKSFDKILETLNDTSKNRGMYYDPEMVPFSGRTFRVAKRVERIIDEKTGKMVQFKSDAIILENVVCEARYAKCRRFCPRSIYPYWREIWLEKVDQSPQSTRDQPGSTLPLSR